VFDPEGSHTLAAARAPRPRDAATLVLVDRSGAGDPCVLMGRRSADAVFMSNKFVFPGGRVEPADARAPALAELHPRDQARLRAEGARGRRVRAFALAAVRETFEETGIRVGRALGADSPPPRTAGLGADWQRLLEARIVPDLGALDFLGRAITQPARTRRFDARFFIAFADEVLHAPPAPEDGDELSALAWVGLGAARSLDIPNVTRFMLDEVTHFLELGRERHRPALLRWSRGGHRLERLP